MAQKHLPIILERKEVEKLLDQPSKKSLTGIRNKAIMKIIANCGLRVSEITNLRTSEIDLETGKFRVVNGKGGKDRNLVIPPLTIEVLKDWQKKKPESDDFFPTLKGGQLGVRYLQQMIKRYALKAGISKRITPHSLRHFYATEHYRKERDIEALRQILGHESISTTTIYITLANIEVEESMKAVKEV